MKKRTTTTLLLLLIVATGTWAANKTFDTTKKYRIVCNQYGTGGFALGANHGADALIYYDVAATATTADALWTLQDAGNGKYAIRNAQTNQYLTFDNVRVDTKRKFLNLTDEAAANDSSYWYFSESGSACAIVSAAKDTVGINVRTDGTYLVGGYTYSTSANALFQLYDEEGNLWGESGGTTPPGGGETPEWGTEYSENSGLAMPVVLTTDLSNPVYYHIRNVRQNKYVTVTTAGSLTETPTAQTLFYFVQGADGVSIFTQNGLYISGMIDTQTSTPKVLATAGASTSDTWTLEFSEEYSGYGLHVKNCEDNWWNGSEYSSYFTGQAYWNDYSGTNIGFYAFDSGSAFTFSSGDERHKAYLDAQQKSGAFTAYLTDITIGGKPLIYDSYYKQYMALAPESSMGGNDYRAVLRYTQNGEGKTYKINIDGTDVISESTYLFKDVAAQKTFTISVKDGEETVGNSQLTFTFMPIVEINGTFSSTYSQGTIRVNQIDTPADTLFNARLKHRGATASSLQKKAYAVKLNDGADNSIDRTFLGLREDNNWILDAMAIDPGRTRNRVSTDLWNDFSTPQYYKESEPKALNGTRGRYVEVLLNGKYQGLYCMTEKLDRKQLKLKKYEEETDNIRGVLYKSDQWSYETFMGHNSDSKVYPMRKPSSFNNAIDTWAGWECQYPDLGDQQPIDWAPLWNAINVVASADNATFQDSVATYFDLPVFLDNYLFCELMLATDNHGKNMFFYSYNKNKYKMMGMAPWDMDGTWGRRWDGSSYLTSDATQEFDQFIDQYEHGQYTLYKRLKELDYNSFNDSLAYRYADLRKTFFEEDALVARFANYINAAKSSGAELREYTRWQSSHDSKMTDLTTELAYTSDWIRSRVAYLDKKYDIENITRPNGIADVNSNSFFAAWSNDGVLTVESPRSTSVSIYNLAGQLVKRTQVEAGISRLGTLPVGIYIVNGKKVMVK